MAAVLGTNVASLWASKNLQSAQSNMANSVERLSSGLRINRARDDAAGLGIGNALTQQINSADQGIRNLNDGISIVQTAEGALAQTSEMAQRILTLSIQGTNGALSTDQKVSITSEMTKLLSGIDSIQARTKFGSSTTTLFAGTTISVYSSKESTDLVSITAASLSTISTAAGGAAATLSTNVATATSSTSVANFQAITSAANAIGGKYLNDCTLYVTLEPCLMCAGAILQSRISRVVFGAFNPGDSSKSTITLLRVSNPQLEVVGGVMDKECSQFLSQWFSKQRLNKG